ncbi:MAG TPA: hypothetical protein VI541_03480 [Actinomycetota bacterium]|nr:hypothetical protein [Actinomycetota bacterium]
MLRLGTLVTALLLTAASMTMPAAAAASPLDVTLSEFPTFLGPDTTLRLTLLAHNAGPKPVGSLAVAISIHEGIQNRSQLDVTFSKRGARSRSIVGSDTISVEGTVEAGETRTITVEKALNDISFFRSHPSDRTYPIRITLRSDSGDAPTIETHLIYFSLTEAPPLGVALVIPLHSPRIHSDATRPSDVTDMALEKAVAPGGRIERILTALENEPQAPVTISPSGTLLDMLEQMSHGHVRAVGGRRTRLGAESPQARNAASALERIQRIARSPGVRLLMAPYSQTSLPTFVRAGLTDQAQRQVDASARKSITDRAGAPIAGWLLPRAGLLDDRTIADLQRLDIGAAVLSPVSVNRPAGNLTEAAPVKLKVRTGVPFDAVISDPGLETRLRDIEGLGLIQARQRFLAETATIMLERPGQVRAVAAVAPLDWSVPTALLRNIIAALTASPWIKGTWPDQIVEGIKPSTNRPVDTASPDTILRAGPPMPPSSYLLAIRHAQEAIDDYADLGGPRDRISTLDRRLFQGIQADDWGSRVRIRSSEAFIDSVVRSVKDEFAKIHSPASQTITLTSHEGVIPLSITSSLGYPVDVVLRLDSDKLRFPDGTRLSKRLENATTTFEVRTIAQATGTFPLRVSVETPFRGVHIDESRLNIRSTAFNRVGVGITAGAGIFLVSWWLAGLARRRIS